MHCDILIQYYRLRGSTMVALRTVSRVYAAVELGALVLAVFVAPPDVAEKSTHFTWWGIASLMAFDVAAALDPPEWRERSFAFFAGTAFTILVGVLGLSIARCSLLSEALDDMGFGGYVAGNLAIHYWPAVRVMMHTPQRLVKEANQSLAAASYLIMYLSVNRASKVYGCRLQEWMVVLFGAIGIAAAQLLRRLSNELEVLAHSIEKDNSAPAPPDKAAAPATAPTQPSTRARLQNATCSLSLWLAVPAMLLFFKSQIGFRPYPWTTSAWFALAACVLSQMGWGTESAAVRTIERWWYRVLAVSLVGEAIIKTVSDPRVFGPVFAPVTVAAVLLSKTQWMPTLRVPAVTASSVLLAGRAASSYRDSRGWGWFALAFVYAVHAAVELYTQRLPVTVDEWLAARLRAAGFVGVGLVFTALAWTS